MTTSSAPSLTSRPSDSTASDVDVGAALERLDSLRVKGFLGPTLKEDQRLEDLGTRAARAAGIEVDNGKLRCPDGAPGAGRFTDMQQSNCMIPLTEEERQKATPAKKSLPQNLVDFKAGLFHSSGRIGRTLQAAGSIALPGDMSDVRRPARSAAFESLTPGGVGGARIGGPRMVRCPSGYEHGGRFSAPDLSGCGRQLFVPPTGVRAASGSARRAGQTGERSSTASGSRFDRVGLTEADPKPLRGGRAGRPVQISRQADIAEVSANDERKRRAGVERALASLSGKKGSFLVRRDGSLLKPTGGASALSGVRTNRDMNGAAFVTSASSLKNLGKDEVPLLLTTDIESVSFSLPGGDSITMSKKRDLTPAERARLGRAWKAGMSIADLEAASHGTVKVDAKIKEAVSAQRIWIVPASGTGAARSVPRWMFEMFLSEGAPGRVGKPWKLRKDGPK